MLSIGSIFTSATGVEAFIERLKTLQKDIRAMGKARIAAIGPATAEALKEYALVVDAMPTEYRAEAIIDAIGAEKIRGARILIPRAQVAREVLPQMLKETGAAEVVIAPAYKTTVPQGAALDRIRDSLSASGYDLIAFTSSSTASNFVEIAGQAESRNSRGSDRSHHGGNCGRTRLRGRGEAAPNTPFRRWWCAIRDYFASQSHSS